MGRHTSLLSVLHCCHKKPPSLHSSPSTLPSTTYFLSTFQILKYQPYTSQILGTQPTHTSSHNETIETASTMHLTNILAVLTALTVSSVALPNPEPNDRPGKETQQTCFEKCRKDGNLSVCWEKCHSKPPAINFETGAKHRRQNDPPKDGHRFVYV